MNTVTLPDLIITQTVQELSTINLPDYPNFIKWVNIQMKGEDSEGKYGELNTVFSFDTLNLEEDFISFENITEEVILSWIETRVGQQQMERYVEQLKRNYIERNFEQIFYSLEQLPWNS